MRKQKTKTKTVHDVPIWTRKMTMLVAVCFLLVGSYAVVAFAQRPAAGGTPNPTPQATSIIIATPSEFDYFRYLINSGTENFARFTKIEITANLNMANYPWTPIGTSQHPFRGIIDFNNHTITGIRDANFLFGTLDTNTEIHNLNLVAPGVGLYAAARGTVIRYNVRLS